MGMFAYGSPERVCFIEDRALLHLQIVIVNKLRRAERFLFRCDSTARAGSVTAFWMSPDIPLRFEYTDGVKHEVNRSWLNVLAEVAYGTEGLYIAPEPDPTASRLSTGERLTREVVGARV